MSSRKIVVKWKPGQGFLQLLKVVSVWLLVSVYGIIILAFTAISLAIAPIYELGKSLVNGTRKLWWKVRGH